MPVVLVHGAGGTHLDWPGALRRLPNTLALDLPGHGKSRLPGRTSIEDYTADVALFLEALNMPKAVIIGHSMGGGIAQMLALTHPEKVAGLVLVATGAKLRVHPDIVERVLHDQAGVAALLKEWIWAPAVPQTVREISYERLMETPAQVVQGDYYACDHFDIRERLAEIQAPTLIIGGTEDRMTPHKFSVFMQENIPQAELFTVEGGGHMLALEQPEPVTEAIRQWLERL
ncbi:MAG: alpha/beta fold hydrolase [Anaerolineae bacterium]